MIKFKNFAGSCKICSHFMNSWCPPFRPLIYSVTSLCKMTIILFKMAYIYCMNAKDSALHKIYTERRFKLMA